MIRTMGFRGEALASIAAVAQVELMTRRKKDELGTKIFIEGSVVKEQLPKPMSVGTNFTVKNLFFNIPARRNFLKSNEEMALQRYMRKGKQKKYCSTCHWYAEDVGTCVNGDSEHCADFRCLDDTCEHWKQKGE